MSSRYSASTRPEGSCGSFPLLHIHSSSITATIAARITFGLDLNTMHLPMFSLSRRSHVLQLGTKIPPSPKVAVLLCRPWVALA